MSSISPTRLHARNCLSAPFTLRHALLGTVLALGSIATLSAQDESNPPPRAPEAQADSRSISLDELEAVIEQRKDALSEAEQRREETVQKRDAVAERLQESQRKQEELLADMRALCEEQAELGGTAVEECMAQFEP